MIAPASGGASTTAALRPRLRYAPLMIAATVVALWLVTFVGYTGSDDADYLTGARGWLAHFPFVGQLWWQVRQTVTIPMAISIGLLGENDYSMTLPGVLYQIGIAWLTFKITHRFAGIHAAVAATLLVLTLPLNVISTSIANVDLAEAFFVSLSLWWFLAATEAPDRSARLLGAGAAAALAEISRDTAISLLLVYFILFVAGFGMKRRRYWIMAGGFIAVILAETLYYGLAAGDPLHRFKIVLAGAANADRVTLPGIGFDTTGALRIHPLIDPFLVIFARVDFGLLFLFCIPAGFWVVVHRQERSKAAFLPRIMLLLTCVSFAFSAIALRHLQLHTRYYMVAAIAAAIVVGCWIGNRLWPRRRNVALLAMAALVGVNLIGLYATNKNPLFGERALVEYLASPDAPGTVVIDPELAFRASTLLGWAGETARVENKPPQAGDLYFYYPRTSGRASPRLSVEAMPSYQPQADWTVMWQQDRDRKLIGPLLEAVGLDRLLPGPIYDRLNRPSPSVTVYRVEGRPG